MGEGVLPTGTAFHTARGTIQEDLNRVLEDRETYDFKDAISACLARLALEADVLTVLEAMGRNRRDGSPLPWPGWQKPPRGPR